LTKTVSVDASSKLKRENHKFSTTSISGATPSWGMSAIFYKMRLR